MVMKLKRLNLIDMKRLFMYVVLAMLVASCTRDPKDELPGVDNELGTNEVPASELLTYM